MINLAQINQFIHAHWVLWLAFIAIAAAIIFEEVKGKVRQTKGISAQGLVMLLNHEKATVIDLREVSLFQQEHILNAVNVPAAQDFSGMMQKLPLDKEQAIVLVDADDSFAFKFANFLQTNAYTKISVLSGGLPAWKNANLPLTSK